MITDLRIENLRDIDPDERGIIVIDLDTGTVLGTNLVVCLIPDDNATPGALEDLLSSDSAAHDYGMQNGNPLFVVTMP